MLVVTHTDIYTFFGGLGVEHSYCSKTFPLPSLVQACACEKFAQHPLFETWKVRLFIQGIHTVQILIH